MGLCKLEVRKVVTRALGSSSFERATAKLNVGDFEWAMSGIGKLGTRAKARVTTTVRGVCTRMSGS